MKCAQEKSRFPSDKWIHPLKILYNEASGKYESVMNPEYRDAPFEVNEIYA
jgi:hypothetical protein